MVPPQLLRPEDPRLNWADTGGSIREPAHLCGITGIKPTSGRTPRTGHIIPYGLGVIDSLTQIDPMVRYVEDLMLALPIICEPDGADPSVIPMPFGDSDKVDLSRLRIAYHTENGIAPLCEDNARVIKTVAEKLQDNGINVVEEVLPEIPLMAKLLSDLRREATGPGIRKPLNRFGTKQPSK